MKKIFRKKIFAFFLSALLVLALSLPVFADMGPKPSVTLKLYYTPGQRYAVTLLGNTALNGPWTAPADYRERMGSREAGPSGTTPLRRATTFWAIPSRPRRCRCRVRLELLPAQQVLCSAENIETCTFYRSEEP